MQAQITNSKTSMSAIAFHEKAGQCQACQAGFSFFRSVLTLLERAASAAILPSALFS